MAAKHLKNLETRLGLRLMVRTTRRQSLTGGRAGYHCALQATSWPRSAMPSRAPRPCARRRAAICASPRPCPSVRSALTPVIADYLSTYPDVSVEPSLSDLVEDLVASRYDLAVRIGEPADSGPIARGLGRYQMMVCAAPSYLERYGTPATPADLVRHQCWIFVLEPSHRLAPGQWRWRRDGLSQRPFRVQQWSGAAAGGAGGIRHRAAARAAAGR